MTLALSANYVRNDWFDQEPSLKFATRVVDRNEILSDTLEKFGHRYDFSATDEDLDDNGEEGSLSGSGTEEENEDEKENMDGADCVDETGNYDKMDDVDEVRNNHVELRVTTDHDELDGILFEKKKMKNTISRNTVGWLTAVYKNSRGFELGTFDSSLLAITMKTQSSKWEELAFGYISDIVSMAHSFITDLLRLTCPNPRIRSGLMSVLIEKLMTKYEAAFDHTHFLLYTERMGTPSTLDHYFNDNLEKRSVPSVRTCLFTY